MSKKETSSPPAGPHFGRPRHMMGPVEKPKNIWKTAKRMIMYMGTQKYALIGLITAVILSSGLSLVMPVLQKEAINTITVTEGFSVDFIRLRLYLIYMGILFFIVSVLTLGQGLWSASVSQKTVKVMRNDMMSKLQKLPVKYFDTHTHGELMSRLTNDIDNISRSISQSLSSFFSGIVTIIGSISLMMYYSRLMTLISLSIVPVGIFVTKKVSTKTRAYFSKQQKGLGELNGHIEEMVTGHKTVIAFNRQQHAIEQFEDINKQLRHDSILAQIFSGVIC